MGRSQLKMVAETELVRSKQQIKEDRLNTA